MSNTTKLVIERIRGLCNERNITPNGLSYIAGVPQATIKSILNGETKSPELLTIKKLCDGFEITLAQFFDTDAFNNLEQEIK
ncbi:MAG: helix-turn-helix transcriptional regulator [Oscillospiraceae bacterium]|nr:helix-turn-helix transcriptional regulator [Oscillospiraceae bacterium]